MYKVQKIFIESILKSERQGKIIHKAKDSITFDLFIHLFKYLLTHLLFPE